MTNKGGLSLLKPESENFLRFTYGSCSCSNPDHTKLCTYHFYLHSWMGSGEGWQERLQKFATDLLDKGQKINDQLAKSKSGLGKSLTVSAESKGNSKDPENQLVAILNQMGQFSKQ